MSFDSITSNGIILLLIYHITIKLIEICSYQNMTSQITYDLGSELDIVLGTYSRRQFEQDLFKYPLLNDAPIYQGINMIIKKQYYEILTILQKQHPNITFEDVNMYPPYLLLFLMTRGYSYPEMTNDQKQLSMVRRTANEETRIVIDKLWDQPLTPKIVNFINAIAINPLEMQKRLDTPFAYWYKYGDEYLPLSYEQSNPNVNILDPLETNLPILLKWTDNQIIQLLDSYHMGYPRLSDFVERRAWVEHIINILRQKMVTGQVYPKTKGK
jgi:hypothetical protein